MNTATPLGAWGRSVISLEGDDTGGAAAGRCSVTQRACARAAVHMPAKAARGQWL